MQAVWEKKCAPKLDNQTLGEKDMEKLVDTVRRVLVGEDSDKDDPGTQGDKAEYQKKRKAVAKKFGVESCSALKDEAKRKECYNALDKAHVADHEEQVELKKMNKEEVEVKKKVTEGVDLKKLKKEYDKNEDKNHHTENYLLLAKAFGSSSEVKKVQEIMKRNQKQGSTSKSDMDWMYKNINPYYDKIRNEEVEMDEAKGTAYPPTIENLRMIVKDKQHQKFMFDKGQAIVDTFTASAMIAVYDAMKKPEIKKKFEEMIKSKEGFMKTQAFAMKMIK